jgi:WD40 repeat protein
VIVWDSETGERIAETTGYRRHSSYYLVTGLAFSPDCRLLAFGGEGNSVVTWDIGSGAKRTLIGQPRNLLAAAFSPDGRKLVTASGGWEYAQPADAATKPVETLLHHGLQPMTIVTFDVSLGRIVDRVEAPGLINVAFSPDTLSFAGDQLPVTAATTWPISVKGVGPGNVVVCEAATGKQLHSFEGTGWFTEFSLDGKLLLNGSNVFDLEANKVLRNELPIAHLFSGNHTILAVKSGHGVPWDLFATTPWSRPVYINVLTGDQRDMGFYIDHPKHGSLLGALWSAVQFSPDRTRAIDNEMRLWKVPH